MEVQRKETDEQGSYFIEENGERVAEMFYTLGPNRIIINHTEVSPDHQKQGLTKALIGKAIDDARSDQFSIVPVCQVARKYFEKNPSQKDVL